MAKRYDIILIDDFDLQVKDGDFVVSEADAQHIQLMALTKPGDWRHIPELGLDAYKFVKGPESKEQHDKLVKGLKVLLKLDGYREEKIDLTEGIQKIKITAE